MIVKKNVVPMPAFQLGTSCPLAEKLTAEGLLLPQADGAWRVKTRESMTEGELARDGDYIKFDSASMPYPTKKDWFEANHTRVEEGLYLQKVQPRKAWRAAEPVCPEVRFLLDRGLLQWDPEQGFGAELWGTWQTADRDAVVVLDRVEPDGQGGFTAVEFHLVAAEEFAVSYEVLGDTE